MTQILSGREISKQTFCCYYSKQTLGKLFCLPAYSGSGKIQQPIPKTTPQERLHFLALSSGALCWRKPELQH